MPGSSPKMLAKAQGLAVDEAFLDLEDAVAPDAKAGARANVVAALNDGDWGGTTRAVRVNDLETSWTYRDVLEVVEGAGANLDCVILPKVTAAAQVTWLDLTLTQIEKTMGYEVGRIGIEPQIENAAGLIAVDAIAAGPRVEAVVFGPADFMASVNMRSLVVGEQPPGYEPGDAYHYVLMRILLAARAAGVQAIDGPYLQIHDVGGFRRQARRSAALGYDGKWVLHPGQIDAAIIVAASAAPAVQRLLADESMQLASLDHVEGLARRFGYFQPVSLKRGSVDPRRDLPHRDITLLATTANLVVQ